MIGLFTTTLAAAATATGGGVNENVAVATEHAFRSNATHLCWRKMAKSPSLAEEESAVITWQSIEDAKRDAYNYLRRNVMAFDLPFLETMGFHNSTDDDDEADGLADGLIEPAIDYAIQAKIEFAYTDALPLNIWREYVLNYANLNEARNNIRTLLWKRVIQPLFLSNTTTDTTNNNNKNRTIAETVRILNTHSWKMLAAKNTESLIFVASQTPAIFDPMSVLAFGYASCTGLAILFVQLLRAAGVPARIAGTAAWNGERSKGNHNWVEVWTGGFGDSRNYCGCNLAAADDCQCGWSFLEPSPDQEIIDTVDRNPCERWFCSAARFDRTKVYAARLESNHDVRFPLAWEWDNQDVPGVDRTDYYRQICAQCSRETKDA